MTEQTERAFQKQPTVFLNDKFRTQGIGKKPKNKDRYWKNIGLGFKTPREAIEGNYIDKKCPFTGNVSIRGRILTGVVIKNKMQRTINMSVHCSPCFRDVSIGDIVTIGECRPLSKTVRFNVLKVIKVSGSKKAFDKF
ncbi:Ribosomal_S17_N domain-containing protein [Meloidogyne graminicola]|uniref:Small ribosomal subunit protein uS17 n=1 Tax=Meloidogyne graminicola TaxID=189291 RepID=A0A8S9ZWZ5_9BILA|nr:Ribosomal_S17_N domain-containing protein [Meloidogyne graminicola]